MNNLLALPDTGPIRRVLALSYDLLMVIALTLTYALVVTMLAVAFTDKKVGDEIIVYGLPFQLGWLATISGFFIYFWLRAGQTIGMRAWRLKLVSETTGSAPTIQQCLLRCVAAPLLIAAGGIGYWWCWIDKDGRAIQDRLTKTRVLLLPKIKKQ